MADGSQPDSPRPASRELAFTRHEGRRGAQWLVEAWAMLARERMPWIGLVLAYYVVLALIEWTPWIGAFLAPILKPVLSVGMLAAAWTQERGGRPELRMLGRGFGANLWALVPLGVVLIVGVAIAIAATALVDGGKLLELLYGSAPVDSDSAAAASSVRATLADPSVELAMLFGGLCALPTILALWWAPALVVFQDASAPAALRASLRAALANWRPVLRYALLVFMLGGVVPSFLTTLVALIVPAAAYPLVASALLLPYVIIFVTVLHIADYVSYRDVFHAGE
ncbi:MAG: hypothetical protein JSS46_14965 [Proteobacteria bacterium]|jgi:hypothetical protein|nr:hypothetical protein [Pseudomonadota bacterium]